MSLPLPRLDDRTWQDLRDEGVSLIPRFAPSWTDHNVSDPGITLIELLAYRTELELFRLDSITAAHRRAFLGVLGSEHLPRGPRPAATLLTFDPNSSTEPRDRHVTAGEYFVPRQPPAGPHVRRPAQRSQEIARSIKAPHLRAAGEPDQPVGSQDSNKVVRVPEIGFRAMHDLDLTGIRIAALQSFDGRAFRDITDRLVQSQPFAVWGDELFAEAGQSSNLQPAVYIGLDLKTVPRTFLTSSRTAGQNSSLHWALTLWCLPDGFSPSSLGSPPLGSGEHSTNPLAPKPASKLVDHPDKDAAGYDGSQKPATHHGLQVSWEYWQGGHWLQVPQVAPFRDETRGFTRPGRVVIPGVVFTNIEETAVGSVPARHFYLRCRLADGRPDRAPTLSSLFSDAVLVEQWDHTETKFRMPGQNNAVMPATLFDLKMADEVAADIQDAAADLVRQGWPSELGYWHNWPLWSEDQLDSDKSEVDQPLSLLKGSMSAVAIGVGSGEANQAFPLPCPANNTLFGDEAREKPGEEIEIKVVTETLKLWTFEPPWGWRPSEMRGPLRANWRLQRWKLVPDLVLGARKIRHFVYDPTPSGGAGKSRYAPPGQIVFGDGENGRVPPPGALIFASYSWSVADAANFAARFIWARSSEKEPHRRDRVTSFPETRFINPLPATGGTIDESLSNAMLSLAREFAAPATLIELADEAAATTLDGLDISDVKAPPMAVNLLDFECLARNVPGTDVARARAWPELDINFPGHKAPGAVTVTVVPSVPIDRPQPTPGLICQVRAFLEERRPITCRVFVIGPDYVSIRIRAILHTSTDKSDEVRTAAGQALQKFLHPTGGGQSGRGWPFGRHVHAGELMRILTNVADVKHVTELQLATADGDWSTTAISIPQRSLVELRVQDIILEVRRDA